MYSDKEWKELGKLAVSVQHPSVTFKALQERLGYTNRQTAEALGVSERAVEEWRSGRNVPKKMVLLALKQLLLED